MDVNLTDLLHGGMRRIQASITLIACLSFLFSFSLSFSEHQNCMVVVVVVHL